MCSEVYGRWQTIGWDVFGFGVCHQGSIGEGKLHEDRFGVIDNEFQTWFVKLTCQVYQMWTQQMLDSQRRGLMLEGWSFNKVLCVLSRKVEKKQHSQPSLQSERKMLNFVGRYVHCRIVKHYKPFGKRKLNIKVDFQLYVSHRNSTNASMVKMIMFDEVDDQNHLMRPTWPTKVSIRSSLSLIDVQRIDILKRCPVCVISL